MPDPTTPSPAPGRLGAFRRRDFRLFWSGQLVSLIGTWMQSVGQSWLVLELTGSPFQLGLVNTLQFTPILLLSAVDGALSDRLGKRRILLVAQAAMMAQASCSRCSPSSRSRPEPVRPVRHRIARRGPADLGSAGERHEDRHARLRADLARDVTLASEVLGDEDVAGAEPPNGAVANLDVHRAR